MMYVNTPEVAGRAKYEISKSIRNGNCTIETIAEEIRNVTTAMLGDQNNGFNESVNPPHADWKVYSATIRIEKYVSGIRIHAFHDDYTDFVIRLDFQTCGYGEQTILPITGEVYKKFATDNETLEAYFDTIDAILAEFWSESSK